MEMTFTAYLWLNWLLVGFFFGLGYFLASAIYNGLVWFAAQRRAQP